MTAEPKECRWCGQHNCDCVVAEPNITRCAGDGCPNGIGGTCYVPTDWYKCFYCEKFFCPSCAKKHFGGHASDSELLRAFPGFESRYEEQIAWLDRCKHVFAKQPAGITYDEQGWPLLPSKPPTRCEHGVAEGFYCEACNREYKRAAGCISVGGLAMRAATAPQRCDCPACVENRMRLDAGWTSETLLCERQKIEVREERP